MAPPQQSSRARIRVLRDQLRVEAAGTAAAQSQLNLLRLQENERPPQRPAPSARPAAPQRPMVPPPAPRGDDPGQRQLDQLRWALDASAKMKRAQSEQRLATPPHLGGRPQTARQPVTAFGTARHSASREGNRLRTSPDNMAVENRRLREENRKLRISGSMTSRQSTPNTDRRPSSGMTRSASMGGQMSARPSSASMTRSMTPSTSGHMAAILRRRQEAEDRLVQEQAAETEAAWVDPAPWGSQGGPLPSAQWATTAQADFKPVERQFLVPNGRATARERSSDAMARRAERQKRAAESTGSLDFVAMGGKTLEQRFWDLHPGLMHPGHPDYTPGCPPSKVASQMKREASYSDVFQVRAPIGPGGYVRESQYRLAGKTDQNYKTMALPPGDNRPFWRVAW